MSNSGPSNDGPQHQPSTQQQPQSTTPKHLNSSVFFSFLLLLDAVAHSKTRSRSLCPPARAKSPAICTRNSSICPMSTALYRRSSSSTARSRVTLVCSEVRGRSISAHISANLLRTQLTHQFLHSSANASSCAATAECVLPLVHFFLSQARASSDHLSSSLATNVQSVPLSSGVSTLQAPRKRCKFIAPLPTSPLPLCPTSPGRHPSERPKFFYVIFASPSY